MSHILEVYNTTYNLNNTTTENKAYDDTDDTTLERSWSASTKTYNTITPNH